MQNTSESPSFLKTALAWSGSVTPKILPRLGAVLLYSAGVTYLLGLFPHVTISITPFEYGGAVLGLLLITRVNAGVDRWWEARKIWGSIVNQSRNLAQMAYSYSSPSGHDIACQLVKWVAAMPYAMRSHLRGEREIGAIQRLLGPKEADKVMAADHMPYYISHRIIHMLKQLRKEGLDDFAFHQAERERAILINDIGASERILKTPIPFVIAINVRRFILTFLLLLPLALAENIGWLTPFIVLITAYPMLSLDEIGIELQNPFSSSNLSPLPLTSICETIETNLIAMLKYGHDMPLPKVQSSDDRPTLTATLGTELRNPTNSLENH